MFADEADFMLDDPSRDFECTEYSTGPEGPLGTGAGMRLPTR
jgi:hypothetical protein